VFKRSEDEKFKTALAENKEAVANARKVILEQSGEFNIDIASAAIKVSTNGTSECGEEDSDPDFWPPHIPIQYHELGLFERFWGRIVRIFI